MSNDSSDVSDQPVQAPLQAHSGLWYAIVGTTGIAALYFVSQIIGSLLVMAYPYFRHWSHAKAEAWLGTSTYAQFFYILIAEALMVAGLVCLLHLFRWRWRTIGFMRPKLSHIGVGIVAAVPYYLLYLAVVVVVSAFVPALNVNQTQEIGFEHSKGAMELAVTFIALVLLPPLVEELAMRGFLYSGLRKAFPKVLSALIVSGIFGAAHLAEGGAAGPLWIGALDTFILSLVLVYLREKTGNLWAGITLHGVKNGIAYFALYLAPLLHLNIH
ncbi:MAG TPA: CPBP family intramembrane glutamic endopeptidase [Candidatus Saccharimonadales bacterium]|nr:CPBP family intramembrane glutamic endopeptidase [Candidatus Saccharimonadales bacterium]